MTTNVYFSQRYQKWHARIYHNRRYFHIGYFVSKRIASKKANDELKRWPEPVVVEKAVDEMSEEVSRFVDEMSMAGVV